MITLGIETTCDETGVALVRDGEILVNLIASQAVHAEYGGTFPELAAREHEKVLLPLVKQALEQANVSLQDIDLIAVAQGPGLMGAVLIGVSAAKALALALDVPLIGVNHVEAHLYGAMMTQEVTPDFPALGLVVSGGHTFMARLESVGKYEILGKTVDDAAGEAFDKVAVMLGLPYPGGAHVEKLAKDGDPEAFDFRGGVVKKSPLNFSFSGLKTRVAQTVVENPGRRADIAASFQRAVVSDLKEKVEKALSDEKCLIVGGGVACNGALREVLGKFEVPVYFPEAGLSIDNGAMIAGLGELKYKEMGESGLEMRAFPKMELSVK